MDKAIFVVLGFLLLVVNYWYLTVAKGVFFSKEIMIAPIQVIGVNDNGGALGKTLASMLQVRLQQIQADLVKYQKELIDTKPKKEIPTTLNPLTDLPVPVELYTLPLVDMQTELWEPANVNVSVGGFQVGGIFDWIHRRVTGQRTMNLTVSIDGGQAVVSGNLEMVSNGLFLRLLTTSKAGDIVDKIAFSMLQQKMLQGKSSDIEILEVSEVQKLVETLFQVTKLNRKAKLKYPIVEEIALLFPDIEKIALKVPGSVELNYFAASMAEGADNKERALFFYKRIDELSTKTGRVIEVVDLETIKNKIIMLAPAAEVSVISREQQFVQAARDYAKSLALTTKDPQIAFVSQTTSGIMALGNVEKAQWEVNPEFMDTYGLPEYVALMARFVFAHYDECFKGRQNQNAVELWNDFRHSLIAYILSTEEKLTGDPKRPLALEFHLLSSLSASLKSLEAKVGKEAVRKLVLALLERYQCDWTKRNLSQNILRVNNELNLIQAQIIQEAFPSP